MSSRVVRSRAEFLAARAELPRTARVGAVLTMGALHDGHAALLDSARAAADIVIATVFVNPAQFGPGEDLARYPRPLEADLDRCRAHGVDLVWVPDVVDVYPVPARTGIDPGELGRVLEGAARPGHFAGVLLVVHKFLELIRPQSAHFGEKDYQQLTLVRAMARDLELPVEVVGVPTVREPDGLARSSRNVFLDAGERVRAAAIPRALRAGQAAGPRGGEDVLAAAAAVLGRADGVAVDYLELRDPVLGPAPITGPARLLTAARVGSTRLIDNVLVNLVGADSAAGDSAAEASAAEASAAGASA